MLFVLVEPQRTAFRRHFEEQLRLYGPQILVNLVERVGPEVCAP
jgi:hypothetical protein